MELPQAVRVHLAHDPDEATFERVLRTALALPRVGLVLVLPTHVRVFAATAPTDMRKSFAGLVGLIENELGQQVEAGGLFLFFSRRRNAVKVLFFTATAWRSSIFGWSEAPSKCRRRRMPSRLVDEFANRSTRYQVLRASGWVGQRCFRHINPKYMVKRRRDFLKIDRPLFDRPASRVVAPITWPPRMPPPAINRVEAVVCGSIPSKQRRSRVICLERSLAAIGGF